MEAFQAEEGALAMASDEEESAHEDPRITAVDLEYAPDEDAELKAEMESICKSLGITEGPGTGRLYFFPSRINVYRTIRRLVTQFRGDPQGLEEELEGKKSNWCRDVRANIKGSIWKSKGYALKVMIPLLIKRFAELGVSKP